MLGFRRLQCATPARQIIYSHPRLNKVPPARQIIYSHPRLNKVLSLPIKKESNAISSRFANQKVCMHGGCLVISLKKYLDSDPARSYDAQIESVPEPFSILLSTYGALLADIGECGESVCPDLSAELKSSLTRIDEELIQHPIEPGIARARNTVHDLLQDWGEKTARHYLDKAGEVRDLLLVMARTAESLGHKDDRYAQELDFVTAQLQSIANLDDVSKMRVSLEESARQLKSSVAQMSAENKSVIDHLRVEVMTYQAKLEKANHLASCDALTGLGSRLWIEARMQQRIESGSSFSVLMIDIKDFRRVNDEFGRMVGDLLLKEFAKELRSSCRLSNLVARWSGDTFLVVLDTAENTALEQAERLRAWISRQYMIPGRSGHASIRLDVSIGCAECRKGETLQGILERADAALCARREPAQQRRSA
jgi:diguanylate cyclase